MTDALSTPTPPTSGGRSVRIPTLVSAVLLPAALVLAGCGDSSDDPVASDTTSSSPSASASASTSPSTTDSVSASPSESAPDPVIDPVVVAAVKPALKKGFPALVSSGLPAGWTVQSADFKAAGGGVWTMVLTDDTGASVTLVQDTGPLDALVSSTLGAGASAGGKVDLGVLGSWSSYTGGSAPAIGTELPSTSVVVSGSDQDHLVALGQTLLAAEDSDMPDAG